MTLSKSAWRTMALVTAFAFFWLATRVDVDNATSPRGMGQLLLGHTFLRFPHPWWLSLHILLRKTYSIVAFAIVGFTANRALNESSKPALRAAAAGGTYSLSIEIAQRIFVAPEPNLESVFDVGCGALGGWLAILADRVISEKIHARGRNAAKRRGPPVESTNTC